MPRKRGAVPPATARQAERMAKAVELRGQGATYQQIADATGVNIATAWHDVHRAVLMQFEDVAEYAPKARKKMLADLEQIAGLLLERIAEGQTVEVDRLLKVYERTAKLLGLDMVVNSGSTTNNVLILAQQEAGAPLPADDLAALQRAAAVFAHGAQSAAAQLSTPQSDTGRPLRDRNPPDSLIVDGVARDVDPPPSP